MVSAHTVCLCQISRGKVAVLQDNLSLQIDNFEVGDLVTRSRF